MTCSKPDARTHERRRHIQQEAATLVIERGFDGFTMDELADVVGVSRRTLFNYVGDKYSAVLGSIPNHPEELIEEFNSSPSSGSPLYDLISTIKRWTASLVVTEQDSATEQLVARATACTPKLAQEQSRRTQAFIDHIAQVLAQRENLDPSDIRIAVLTKTVIGILEVARTQALAVGTRRSLGETLTATLEAFAAAITVPEAARITRDRRWLNSGASRTNEPQHPVRAALAQSSSTK